MARQEKQKNMRSTEQGNSKINWCSASEQEHFGAVQFVSLLYHKLPEYHGKAVTANLPNEKTGREEIELGRFYNLDDLKKIVTEDRYEYISVNPFIGHGKRESDAAKYTNTIFIDVDAHQYESHKDLRTCIHKTKKALEKAYADKTLPVPTMITDTGRGLGIYYILNNSIALRKGSENQIRLYDQIYEGLLTRYGQVLSEKEGLASVDWNVKDRARLCRLPGYRHDGVADNCYLAFVSNFVTVEDLKAYKASKEKPEAGEKKPVKYHPIGQAREPRAMNMELLQELWGDKCTDKCRELMCFIYHSANVTYMDKESAIEKLYAYNNNFPEPLPEKEIEHIIRENEAGQNVSESHPNRYSLPNDWVRTVLQLTPEDEKLIGFGKRKREIEQMIKNLQNQKRNEAIAKAIHTTDKFYEDIAKEFGVSLRKVNMIADAHGVRRKKDKGKKHPEFEEGAEAAVTEVDAQPRPEEADTKEVTAQPKAKNKKTVLDSKKPEEPETAQERQASAPVKEYPNKTLMDQITHPDNMMKAGKKIVSRNKKAGNDGMDAKGLSKYLETDLHTLIVRLRNGAYQPKGMRKFEKEKEYDPGKKRTICIPTSIDRMVQQAILQKLNPIFDPTFSPRSYGFRPGQSTMNALERCRYLAGNGYEYVIALDFSSYFDTVPQQKLMDIVGETIRDIEVIKLIWKFLVKGATKPGHGIPQGSPLSPLLGNIMLNQLDRYLEQQHIEFVRYADDCMMLFRSEEEAYQALETVITYAEQVMGLQINRKKTVVGHISNVAYLGYGFRMEAGRCQYVIPEAAKDRIRRKIENLLKRYRKRKAMFEKECQQAVQGWLRYYKKTEEHEAVSAGLQEWIGYIKQVQWPQAA